MDKFLLKNREREKTVCKEKPASVPKKRKYQDDYLGFGFIKSEKDDSLPLCLICFKVLTNDSMKPSKIKTHMETKEYFEALLTAHRNQTKKIKKFASTAFV